jgi:carbon-monoxide dehydrogenase medium subunit
LKGFEFLRPTTLEEAFQFLQIYEDSRVMAGGTDLLIALEKGKTKARCLIDIGGISELRGIRYNDIGHLCIGAMTKVSELIESPVIMRCFPVLSDAAIQLGSWQIRNLATLGGNLCNASPGADLAPPLLVLGASAIIQDKDREIAVPMENFWTGPGSTILSHGSILKRIEIPPLSARTKSVFLKHTIRKSIDLAIASIALMVEEDDSGSFIQCRIALGSVAPTPLRARKAESLVLGQNVESLHMDEVAESAAEESQPIHDLRSSEWYRRRVVKVLVGRALMGLIHSDQNLQEGCIE